MEALEARAKQFRSRDGIWPFRVPHEPLDLETIISAALADDGGRLDAEALRSRTVLRMSWDDHTWELWVISLPSGILLYCDDDGHETRILASARRGNPGDADGFFLERLAETRGHDFGIEMAGPAPDKVRSSIGDREFLAEVFVELFEGSEAQHSIATDAREATENTEHTDRDGTEPSGADFRHDVERWLEEVLTAPPAARRQPRVREHDESV
jgi:hypothetical protein